MTKTGHGELLFNYDWIKEQGSGSWCYEITDEQVMVILAVANRMKWFARWYSPNGVVIDTDWVEEIIDNLQAEFYGGGCMPNLEFQIGDGTGGLVEGDLYWRINGGAWVDIGHVVGADGATGAPGADGTCMCPGTITDPGNATFAKKCDKSESLSYAICGVGINALEQYNLAPADPVSNLADALYGASEAGSVTLPGCYNVMNYLSLNAGALSGWILSYGELHEAIYCSGITSLGDVSSGDIAEIEGAISGNGDLTAVQIAFLTYCYQALVYSWLSERIFTEVVISPRGGDCSAFFCGGYEWEKVFDFTASSGSPYVAPYDWDGEEVDTSQYSSGVGYIPVNYLHSSGFYKRDNTILVDWSASGTREIVNILFTLSLIYPENTNQTAFELKDESAGVSLIADFSGKTVGQYNSNYNWQGQRNMTNVMLGFYLDTEALEENLMVDSVIITSMTIRGNGSNPFV